MKPNVPQSAAVKPQVPHKGSVKVQMPISTSTKPSVAHNVPDKTVDKGKSVNSSVTVTSTYTSSKPILLRVSRS